MVTDDQRGAVWITEGDVAEVMGLADAIVALRSGLALEHRGEASALEKTHTTWGGGHTLHALGASFQGLGLVGTKVWAHTAGGATPLLAMWGSDDGQLVAVIEAFALGQMRTSGLSGVATDLLARSDATRFALLGAGAQALAQAAAVCAVRPVSQITVFSRDRTKADRLAATLREQVAADVRATDVVDDALGQADIVTTATRARDPIVAAAALNPGVHINAVGAITPERRELAADVVERAAIITCDEVNSARRLSSDLLAVLGDDSKAWERVQPLSELASEAPRRGPHDLTLYKGMGTGLADVALGAAILQGARERQLGRPIDQPVRVRPRLFVSETGTGADS